MPERREVRDRKRMSRQARARSTAETEVDSIGRLPVGAPADRTVNSDPRLGRLMLPLRLFLGVTFIYAGLVKLLDPSFLDPTAAASMVAQLHAFARDSPLAPLINAVAIPFATPVGLLIALGELAVGVGAITGLAGRPAAWGGCLISGLFFLTASWGTSPYFYGPPPSSRSSASAT
jgi:uncharacterized membrane protein YphA (DoxX/SURF4 family)